MEDVGFALLGALVPLLALMALYVVIRQAVLSALVKHTNLVRQQDAEAAEPLASQPRSATSVTGQEL